MYVVLLEFAQGRDRAAALLQAHNDWLRQGMEEGAFLLAGSLGQGAGGMLLATEAEPALQARLSRDPFVAEGVVSARLLQVTPRQADPRLAFLVDAEGARP